MTAISLQAAVFSVLLKLPVRVQVTFQAKFILVNPVPYVTNKIANLIVKIASVHFHMASQT